MDSRQKTSIQSAGVRYTLTVIKTKDGAVFVGYFAHPWSKQFNDDPRALVYSLVNQNDKPFK